MTCLLSEKTHEKARKVTLRAQISPREAFLIDKTHVEDQKKRRLFIELSQAKIDRKFMVKIHKNACVVVVPAKFVVSTCAEENTCERV